MISQGIRRKATRRMKNSYFKSSLAAMGLALISGLLAGPCVAAGNGVLRNPFQRQTLPSRIEVPRNAVDLSPESSIPRIPAPPVAVASDIPLPPLVGSKLEATLANTPAPVVAGVEPTGAPEVGKSKAFYSREELESQRGRCSTRLLSAPDMAIASSEALVAVKFSGLKGCFTAVSTEADWLELRAEGEDELQLDVEANNTNTPRKGRITVLTPNQTFVVQVKQAGKDSPPAVRTGSAPSAEGVGPDTQPSQATVGPATSVKPLAPGLEMPHEGD